MNEIPPLDRLNAWYAAQCNDDWEHHYGIVLETLDNPGWCIRVDVTGTPWAERTFDTVETRLLDSHEWVRISKDAGQINGACGPKQLDQMLGAIAVWLDPEP